MKVCGLAMPAPEYLLIGNTGVDRMHKSMTSYVKAISKRNEGDDKEKTLPIAHLGSSMVSHGEDFDGSSEYGQSLISTWPANLRELRQGD